MDMLHSQQLYNPANDLIMAKQHESLELLEKFNALSVKDKKQCKDLMKQMFKSVGEGSHVEPPLRANWGGRFLSLGKNVWVGSGAIILPGVKIGDDSIVGAGSVVTKNIPNGVVAVGNPCRVLRQVRKDEADSK